MPSVLLGIGLYVLAQLLIGVWVSRRVRTEADYLVAGRSLGYGLTTFTVFATWFGAETCIGSTGSIYVEGLAGGTADPFGYGLCLLLMGLFFAAPLWRRRLTTLADLFRQRYSPTVERVAVLLMVPSGLLWAAAQIRAFGQVLAASSGWEVTWTITLAAVVVVVYTISGGLLADAWTDLIQGIALMVGLILLGIAVWQSEEAALATIPTERLNPFHGYASWLDAAEAWAIPVIGSVLSAELVARILGARSANVAQRSSIIASGLYLLIGLIPVTLGLLGPQIMPGLEHSEQLLPLLAARYLHGVLFVAFAGALVSAILSTVDSALLVASSLVSHNLVVPLLPGLTEKQKVWIARGGVAFFGLIAYVGALYAEGVYALVEEASAFGSAGLFVVILFGLFSRQGGARTALATLGIGILAWLLGAYLLDWPYPYLISLGAAFGTYLVGMLLERTPISFRLVSAA